MCPLKYSKTQTQNQSKAITLVFTQISLTITSPFKQMGSTLASTLSSNKAVPAAVSFNTRWSALKQIFWVTPKYRKELLNIYELSYLYNSAHKCASSSKPWPSYNVCLLTSMHAAYTARSVKHLSSNPLEMWSPSTEPLHLDFILYIAELKVLNDSVDAVKLWEQ